MTLDYNSLQKECWDTSMELSMLIPYFLSKLVAISNESNEWIEDQQQHCNQVKDKRVNHRSLKNVR